MNKDMKLGGGGKDKYFFFIKDGCRQPGCLRDGARSA